MNVNKTFSIIGMIDRVQMMVSPFEEHYSRIEMFDDKVHEIGQGILNDFVRISDLRTVRDGYATKDDIVYSTICDKLALPCEKKDPRDKREWVILTSEDFTDFLNHMPVGDKFFERLDYIYEQGIRENRDGLSDDSYAIFSTVRFSPYDYPENFPDEDVPKERYYKNIGVFIRLIPYDNDYTYCTIRYGGYKDMSRVSRQTTRDSISTFVLVSRRMYNRSLSSNSAYKHINMLRTKTCYKLTNDRIRRELDRGVWDAILLDNKSNHAQVMFLYCGDLGMVSERSVLDEEITKLCYTTTAAMW